MEWLNHLWSDQLIFALGWSVLHSLWQGAAFASLTGIYLNFKPNLAARKRYLVAFSGLLAILAAALLTFFWYLLAPHPAEEAMPGGTENPANNLLIIVTAPEAQLSMLGWVNRHLGFVVQFWSVGVILFGLRSLIGWIYAQSMKRRRTRPAPEFCQTSTLDIAARLGIRRKVEVLESALLQTPVVIGALKPVILLPLGIMNRLTPAELEAVLAHELAHILRQDYLLNLLQTFVEVLFYFNPAVWYLASVIAREREHSCDDLAMHITGNRLAYAKALVILQEIAQPGPKMAMALSRKKGALWVRIQRILQPDKKKSVHLMEKITFSGLIMAAVFALNFQAVQGASQPDKPIISLQPWQVLSMPADSLPMEIDRVVFVENGERWEAELIKGKIIKLKVNDREVPATEFPQYEARLNEKMKSTGAFGGNASGSPEKTDAKRVITKVIVINEDGDEEIEREFEDIRILKDSVRVMVITDSTHQWKVKSKDENGMRTITIDGTNMIWTPESSEGRAASPTMKFKGSDVIYIKGLDTLHVMGMNPEGFLSEGAITEMLEGMNIDPEKIVETRMIRRGPDSKGIQLIEMEGENMEELTKMQGMKWLTLDVQAQGGGKTRNALERELLRDGLIEEGKGYSLELRENFLKVDGKKLPEGLARKYCKIYEQSTGMSLSNGGKVVIRK